MTPSWEEIYKRGELLNTKHHPQLVEVIEIFKSNNLKRVLDLGCGAGRHTVYLASRGFDVYGLDVAPTGLAHTIQTLSEKSLNAHLALHDMSSLPYDDDYFDAVISIQVIHHNLLDTILKTIEEISRVIREGGLIWITTPVSKEGIGTKFKEVEPDTYIPLNGQEEGIPHHYFTKEEIPVIFSNFSILDFIVDHFNHFSIIAKKKMS